MGTIRKILIVDDHPIFRQGLRVVLSKLPFLTMIMEAGNGIEAIDLAFSEDIDLIIMDFRMPEMDGFDAAQAILRRDNKKKLS
jgi:two-component system response regulator NreC